MKKPYLDQDERDTLRLNRDNLIYTPTWIAVYELKVACHTFRRAILRAIIKNQWIFFVAWMAAIVTLIIILGT